MIDGRLDRVAVLVSDLDAVKADLEKIFGWEITILDVPSFGIRVGLCEEGFELVEQTDGSPVPPGGPLTQLHIRVDDIDHAAEVMREAGVPFKYQIETPGGLKERIYAFHGLPLTLYTAGPDLIKSCRGDLGPDEYYEPRITEDNRAAFTAEAAS